MKIPIQDAIMIFETELEARSSGYYDHLANGGQGDCAEEAGLDALRQAIEALKIADRLEQAETRICGTPIAISIFVRTAGESDAWIDGYKQALVDIRGDNND